MTREMISLQVGRKANFVGTHFWNAQETLFMNPSGDSVMDHYALFRAGLNMRGEETFTPRLVMIDAKEHFGSFKKESGLYPSESMDVAGWSHEPHVIEQPSFQKNAFQTYLESSEYTGTLGQVSFSKELEQAEFWSDFNKLYYHPKTMVEMNQICHGNETNALSSFDQGMEYMGQQEDLIVEDRIRFFLEECDQFQGFQLMTDVLDGFSGLSIGLLNLLLDFTPKTVFTVFGASEAGPSSSLEAMNHALFLSSLPKEQSVYSPLWSLPSSPLIHLDRSNLYQFSAFAATAIDTITTPLRTNNSAFSMSHLKSMLNSQGNTPLHFLQCALPPPIIKRPESPLELNPQELQSVMPYEDDVLSGYSVYRGLNAVEHPQLKQGYTEYMEGLYHRVGRGHAQIFDYQEPVLICESYPQFFDPQINTIGQVEEKDHVRAGLVTETPVLTRLYTGHSTIPFLEKIIQHIRPLIEMRMGGGKTWSSLDYEKKQKVQGHVPVKRHLVPTDALRDSCQELEQWIQDYQEF